jgi:hypothetical protein
VGTARIGKFAASAAVFVAAGTAAALLLGGPTAIGDAGPSGSGSPAAGAEPSDPADSASAEAQPSEPNDSASAGGEPAGSHGTVKVSKRSVDCTVQVDFYGFDKGDVNADLTFWAHPPTAPNGAFTTELLVDTVFAGEDDNSGGGSEAGLDASRTYSFDLSDIEPHRVKGWHIRLDVRSDGSPGTNLKHKVFWVTGCEGPSPAPSQTS